jgi:type I restriction enzyme S subunit
MQEIEKDISSMMSEVPEGWSWVKIGDLSKIFVGKDLKENCFSKGKSESFKFPVYSNTVEEFGLYGYYDFEEFNGESLTVVGRGAGLGTAFTRTGGFGAIGRLLVLFPKKDCKAHFITEYINGKLRIHQESGGIPQLTGEQLYNYKILTPPLPEQRAIADCLSTWDSAIRATEQLIAQKELQKKWLMQQLLTGKKRLKGFSGEWRERKLGEFLVESRILSEDSSPDRRITVKLSLNGVEKREVRGTESKDSTLYFIRKAGQFIYGKQNLHKGAFGIIPDELNEFESSQDLPAFDFKDNVNDQYFLLFISQDWFYKSLENIASGTGSKRIHPKSLFKVKVLWPKFAEQQAIASILSESDRELDLLRNRLQKIREQKKGLMQVLLTGKRRLNLKK